MREQRLSEGALWGSTDCKKGLYVGAETVRRGFMREQRLSEGAL
jgi:hypothetical protein